MHVDAASELGEDRIGADDGWQCVLVFILFLSNDHISYNDKQALGDERVCAVLAQVAPTLPWYHIAPEQYTVLLYVWEPCECIR